jgi:serralysin
VTAVDPKTGLFTTTERTPLNDVLQGLDGNDTLLGGELADTLNGGLGNDTLDGGNASDTLLGGAGNDVLMGGSDDRSVDLLSGGAGNDVYYLSDGAVDTVDDKGLKADSDRVIVPAQWATYTLPNSIEEAALVASLRASNLIGNLSDNTLIGNEGVNSLVGAKGHDSLYGGAGKDVLNGGPGNDYLQGGAGVDKLTGGKGMDQFVLDAELPASPDFILDFTPSDDSLVLDDSLFSQLRVGALPETQLALGAQALDKNDYVLYDAKQGVLLYDADASGAGIALQIAVLGKNLALTAADFMVI